MSLVYNENDGIETWENVVFRYRAALKKVTLEMEILDDEFNYLKDYNPIEHIKSRLKEPESIVKKLKRHGYESTIENMVKYISDIAGVRIICSFTSDIYDLAERISRQLFTHNWSLKMLSDKSGVPYETLKKISNAKIENPSLRSAVKIAAAFDCSLDYLTGFSDVENINKHSSESYSYLNSL